VVFVPSLLVVVTGAGMAVESLASLSETSSAHSRLDRKLLARTVFHHISHGNGWLTLLVLTLCLVCSAIIVDFREVN